MIWTMYDFYELVANDENGFDEYMCYQGLWFLWNFKGGTRRILRLKQETWWVHTNGNLNNISIKEFIIMKLKILISYKWEYDYKTWLGMFTAAKSLENFICGTR